MKNKTLIQRKEAVLKALVELRSKGYKATMATRKSARDNYRIYIKASHSYGQYKEIVEIVRKHCPLAYMTSGGGMCYEKGSCNATVVDKGDLTEEFCKMIYGK